MIKHALTREVAYASLLKAKRAPLHAGFAQWLERNAKGEDEHAPLLAHHYAEAVRPEDLDLAWPGREQQAEALRDRAVSWSRRAAELAIGRYEIDEGLALLRPRSQPRTEPREQAAIWQRIGQACALKYDGEGFWEAMQASAGDRRSLGRGVRRPRPGNQSTCRDVGPAAGPGVDPRRRAGSSRPWNSPRKAPSPKGTRSPRWQMINTTKPPPARPWRSPSGWAISIFAARR